jgi:Protein of unknown function (DUF3775)
MKLSEIIRKAITMHRAIPELGRSRGGPKQAARAVPKLVPASQLPLPGPPSAEMVALTKFLVAQPVAVINAIAVLLYLGRGDFAEDFDFDDCYAQIADTFHTARYAALHIIHKPFAEYLETGLRRLRQLELDVDRLL